MCSRQEGRGVGHKGNREDLITTYDCPTCGQDYQSTKSRSRHMKERHGLKLDSAGNVVEADPTEMNRIKAYRENDVVARRERRDLDRSSSSEGRFKGRSLSNHTRTFDDYEQRENERKSASGEWEPYKDVHDTLSRDDSEPIGKNLALLRRMQQEAQLAEDLKLSSDEEREVENFGTVRCRGITMEEKGKRDRDEVSPTDEQRGSYKRRSNASRTESEELDIRVPSVFRNRNPEKKVVTTGNRIQKVTIPGTGGQQIESYFTRRSHDEGRDIPPLMENIQDYVSRIRNAERYQTSNPERRVSSVDSSSRSHVESVTHRKHLKASRCLSPKDQSFGKYSPIAYFESKESSGDNIGRMKAKYKPTPISELQRKSRANDYDLKLPILKISSEVEAQYVDKMLREYENPDKFAGLDFDSPSISIDLVNIGTPLAETRIVKELPISEKLPKDITDSESQGLQMMVRGIIYEVLDSITGSESPLGTVSIGLDSAHSSPVKKDKVDEECIDASTIDQEDEITSAVGSEVELDDSTETEKSNKEPTSIISAVIDHVQKIQLSSDEIKKTNEDNMIGEKEESMNKDPISPDISIVPVLSVVSSPPRPAGSLAQNASMEVEMPLLSTVQVEVTIDLNKGSNGQHNIETNMTSHSVPRQAEEKDKPTVRTNVQLKGKPVVKVSSAEVTESPLFKRPIPVAVSVPDGDTSKESKTRKSNETKKSSSAQKSKSKRDDSSESRSDSSSDDISRKKSNMSSAQLASEINTLLKDLDITTVSSRGIRRYLEDKFSTSFQDRKNEIEEISFKAIRELTEANTKKSAQPKLREKVSRILTKSKDFSSHSFTVNQKNDPEIEASKVTPPSTHENISASKTVDSTSSVLPQNITRSRKNITEKSTSEKSTLVESDKTTTSPSIANKLGNKISRMFSSGSKDDKKSSRSKSREPVKTLSKQDSDIIIDQTEDVATLPSSEIPDAKVKITKPTIPAKNIIEIKEVSKTVSHEVKFLAGIDGNVPLPRLTKKQTDSSMTILRKQGPTKVSESIQNDPIKSSVISNTTSMDMPANPIVAWKVLPAYPIPQLFDAIKESEFPQLPTSDSRCLSSERFDMTQEILSSDPLPEIIEETSCAKPENKTILDFSELIKLDSKSPTAEIIEEMCSMKIISPRDKPPPTTTEDSEGRENSLEQCRAILRGDGVVRDHDETIMSLPKEDPNSFHNTGNIYGENKSSELLVTKAIQSWEDAVPDIGSTPPTKKRPSSTYKPDVIDLEVEETVISVVEGSPRPWVVENLIDEVMQFLPEKEVSEVIARVTQIVTVSKAIMGYLLMYSLETKGVEDRESQAMSESVNTSIARIAIRSFLDGATRIRPVIRENMLAKYNKSEVQNDEISRSWTAASTWAIKELESGRPPYQAWRYIVSAERDPDVNRRNMRLSALSSAIRVAKFVVRELSASTLTTADSNEPGTRLNSTLMFNFLHSDASLVETKRSTSRHKE